MRGQVRVQQRSNNTWPHGLSCNSQMTGRNKKRAAVPLHKGNGSTDPSRPSVNRADYFFAASNRRETSSQFTRFQKAAM